jgi:hypothetical protein
MLKKIAFLLFSAASLWPHAAADDDQTAQTSQKAVSSTADASAPKKPDTSGWWQKSSLDFPGVSQVLLHVDGSLSFMDAAGNTSGTTIDTAANAYVRKSRWTSHFFGQMTRKRITFGFGAGSADYDERTLREQVDFDLTRRVALFGGIEDYTNTLFFMKERLNTYGGAGATFYRSERHNVFLGAALGHANFVFDRQRMLSLPPFISANIRALATTSPSGGGALAMQAWRWRITGKVAFTEDATYMNYFDTILGHRWTINLGGDVPITRHFSFVPAYRLKEETNVYVHALTVKPLDRTFVMGVRVSL